METIWTYNGLEYEVDFSDYLTAEIFEEFVGVFSNITAISGWDTMTSPERLKTICNALINGFDFLFGDGAAHELSGGKLTSFAALFDPWKSLLDFSRKQSESMANLAGTTQIPNRAHRRTIIKT
jgi:hypothetical protein